MNTKSCLKFQILYTHTEYNWGQIFKVEVNRLKKKKKKNCLKHQEINFQYFHEIRHGF